MHYQTMHMHMPRSKHIDIAHIVRVNHASFSENEIIAVNDMLLSNGLHEITVRNKKIGREIIDVFLSLLNRYHRVYWLSGDGCVPAGTINLYKQLKQFNALHDPAQMYEYMCTQFDPSFLVIECGNGLESEHWYEQFHQTLHDGHIFDHIPVVHLSFMQ